MHAETFFHRLCWWEYSRILKTILYNFTLYKMLCVLFKLATGFLQNAQPFNRSNLLFCHVAARVLHSSIGAFFAFKFILKQFSRWTCTFQHPAGYYRSGWTTATEWFRRRRRICHLCRIARGPYRRPQYRSTCWCWHTNLLATASGHCQDHCKASSCRACLWTILLLTCRLNAFKFYSCNMILQAAPCTHSI